MTVKEFLMVTCNQAEWKVRGMSNIEKYLLHHIMDDDFFEYYHCRYDEQFTIKMHEHQFHEVYLFLAGDASYIVEGRTYKLQPYDILLISNGDIHCPVAAKPLLPYECILIWIGDDLFQSLKSMGADLMICFKHAQQHGSRLFRPNKSDIDKILSFCNAIEAEQTENRFGGHIIVYSAIMQILVMLNRAYFETSDARYGEVQENELVNQILAYINNHIAENLTLECIASHFYISKDYLSHQFKQFTGFSTYQYIVKKRLKTAYNLLHSGANVSEACYQCRFNDYSNFLKVFRREFGKNPSEVRKRIRPLSEGQVSHGEPENNE